MKTCKLERKLRKEVLHESQRHLCAVRAKFMKRYTGNRHRSSQRDYERQDNQYLHTGRGYKKAPLGAFLLHEQGIKLFAAE